MVRLLENVLLSDFSNYRIGGPARLFAKISSFKELIEVLKQVYDNKVFVLGEGTNVLINDRGFDGLVIHNKIKGFKPGENNLSVGSGVLVKEILDYCIENSLSGFEWAGGLPGTIGGAVRGNAGAFGGETKDSVSKVESIDLKTLEIKKRTNRECNFSYRNSIFKKDGKGEFILFVNLRFEKGNKDEIASKINEKIEYRKKKHPLEYPNIGSIFKNFSFESLPENLKKEFGQYMKNDPFPVMPTAKIIALSGVKGARVGGAMLSDKHTNFIVNTDHATSNDVRELIRLVKQKVKEKFGLSLEEEIIYL